MEGLTAPRHNPTAQARQAAYPLPKQITIVDSCFRMLIRGIPKLLFFNPDWKIKGAVSRQSNFANYSPSIAMELKVEIRDKQICLLSIILEVANGRDKL